MDYCCKKLGIKESLHQMGREIDSEFDIDELLFRRFYQQGEKKDWIGQASKTAALFPLSDDSYNREKYSDQEDVLCNNLGQTFEGWGIFSLKVNQITNFQSPVSVNGEDFEIELVVKHKPEKCNYAHTEIVAYRDGKPIAKGMRSVRTHVRDILLELCQVLVPTQMLS